MRSSRVGLSTALALTAVATLAQCTLSGYADPTGSAPAAAPPAAPAQADRASDDRPNVFMITIDDGMPSDLRYLPKVRHLLADHGTTLTNAIDSTPICVPARATLLTGQYAHNHGAYRIHGDHGGYRAMTDDANTLPVWLQDAGYDTLFVGKYLNGYGLDGSEGYVPPGWTQWRGELDPYTYRYFRPAISVNGTVKQYERKYSTNVLADTTDRLLSAPARKTRPWYLWLNYVAPHIGKPSDKDDPTRVYPHYKGRRVTTPSPARGYRNDFEGLPLPRTPDMFNNGSGPDRRPWSRIGRKMLREAYQQRVESLQSVDDAVAHHIRILKRRGMWDDTIVIFSSDNGYAVGQHNVFGKEAFYRPITTVPTIVRGPGIPEGKRVGTLVSQPDLVASIVASTGATPGRALDGTDVWPLLRGPDVQRTVPIEAWPVRGGDTPYYTGVRAGSRWTYVRMRNGTEYLYDHRTDPYELRNLAGSSKSVYRQKLAELRAESAAAATCAGATCPGVS